MREENVFFLKAKEFCGRPLVTCGPGDSVAEAARRMSDRSVSSIVVCEGDRPLGIITDRDLRNKVIPAAMNPKQVLAAGIMSAPVLTVLEEDLLFEVMYRMSRYNIHRLPIVDAKGCLKGIVTDSDILRLETDTPQQLVRDLEHADTLRDLGRIHRKVSELVVRLSRTGVKTADLVRLIAHLNDALILRLVWLLREEEFTGLPQNFAFLALGSEGRREQTLKTDQDNALVFSDAAGPEELRALEVFSGRLIESLVAVGVPPCPGGVMASNPQWRDSVGGWSRRLASWAAVPSPENILNFSMFADFRLLFGDAGLEAALFDVVRDRVRENELFLVQLAKNALRFPPPLGWFGRIRAEKAGPQRGRLDIKKAGIFPVTEGVKILALQAGLRARGTTERLRALGEAGVLSAEAVLDLETNYNFLVFLRLRGQVSALRQRSAPTDFVTLADLNSIERARLRIAFSVVKSFQSLLRSRFQLNFVSG